MTQTEYVPGVCNIGPDEIARRRNLGWVALAITLLLLLTLGTNGGQSLVAVVCFLPGCDVGFRFFAGVFPLLCRVCTHWSL